MRKKQKTQQKEELHRIPPQKSQKSKNKEMFTQLKTHEQNRISKMDAALAHSTVNAMINEGDQIDYDEKMQPQLLTNSKQIEEVCAIVQNMITKNKISAKNAFDVPFIDLQKMRDFDQIGESDNGWRRISSTLENDSKIYSYRVDAIHSIAYRIMNTMSRNQDPESEVQGNTGDANKGILDAIIPFPVQNQFDTDVGLHLEKNIESINVSFAEREWVFNPNYERTKRRFDQCGHKGLLLNNIQLDNNLQLSLNQSRHSKPIGLFVKPMPVSVSKLTEKISIFKNVENKRKDVSNFTEQQFINSNWCEINWKKVQNGEFMSEIQEKNDYQMDVQVEQREDSRLRRVQDTIKFKNKRPLRTKNDIVHDGQSWLTDMDRKMLGLHSSEQNNQPTKKLSSKTMMELNEDFIDFKTSALNKNSVFSDQTMERQKNEHNEQIQQKHLLPIRLFNKFKVEQIMTLREEPVQNLIQLQLEHNDFIRQVEQVDIKRQQMSIRQSKQKLKSMVNKSTDFINLYHKFGLIQKQIGPELCFLTILHLANENNLRLQQRGQSNFLINS